MVNYDVMTFTVIATFNFQDTNQLGFMAATITSIVPSNPLKRFGIDQQGPNTGGRAHERVSEVESRKCAQHTYCTRNADVT